MAGIASTFAQAGACHDPMSTTDISIFLTKCYETLPAGQANRTSDLLDRDKKKASSLSGVGRNVLLLLVYITLPIW